MRLPVLAFDSSAAHCEAALLLQDRILLRHEAMEKGQAERLLQTARFDPQGNYIRRWIPELAGVADAKKFTAAPDNGRPLAPDYPLPVVNHQHERDRTLAIFKRHREKSR